MTNIYNRSNKWDVSRWTRKTFTHPAQEGEQMNRGPSNAGEVTAFALEWWKEKLSTCHSGHGIAAVYVRFPRQSLAYRTSSLTTRRAPSPAPLFAAAQIFWALYLICHWFISNMDYARLRMDSEFINSSCVWVKGSSRTNHLSVNKFSSVSGLQLLPERANGVDR
jgi:hypothetical protein